MKISNKEAAHSSGGPRFPNQPGPLGILPLAQWVRAVLAQQLDFSKTKACKWVYEIMAQLDQKSIRTMRQLYRKHLLDLVTHI